ncbi:hypothetical protein J6590_053166 [Homalodisca vitripennis]|nr:hypothetical protein J6590_053166 [Homalodisca vitripennis]
MNRKRTSVFRRLSEAARDTRNRYSGMLRCPRQSPPRLLSAPDTDAGNSPFGPLCSLVLLINKPARTRCQGVMMNIQLFLTRTGVKPSVNPKKPPQSAFDKPYLVLGDRTAYLADWVSQLGPEPGPEPVRYRSSLTVGDLRACATSSRGTAGPRYRPSQNGF